MSVRVVPALPLSDLVSPEAAGQAVVEAAKENEAVWVLTADLMHSTKTEPFALAFPDRFVNVGIAEQTMVGVAAGLATCGKIPFVATLAALITMRACEQVRTDVAYPNLSVKLYATHAGLALGTGGTTHHATEDVAIMRSMANMTVLVPCDARETREAVLAAVKRPGPVYIRLGRGQDPIVYPREIAYEIGKAITVREGGDITLIGCGRTVAECFIAAQMLQDDGIQARVLDMHTVKPLDVAAVAKAVAETRMLFSVEEHNIVGGLGGAVAEAMADLGSGVPLVRLGLRDIYAAIGSQTALLEKYGLTGPQIAERVLAATSARK